MEAASNVLRLVEPAARYAEAIWQFREAMLGSDFAGCGTLEQCASAKEWLESVERCKQGKTERVTRDYLPSHPPKRGGIIDLRHPHQSPILNTWGGHIGYSVHPKERRRGYATEMLRLNLLNCKQRGIDRVLITCDAANAASERVLLANGGVFDSTVAVDGELIKRYWIDLN